MKSQEEIITLAKSVITEEAQAVLELCSYVDNDFAEIVHKILAANGRVIVTGIGKSANIANKIVATMNSTGTPAVFMHAADAIHGDLGIVQKNDTVICISKSGNTPEIKVLVPLVKSMGNTLVGLTANKSSYLGTQADHVMHAYVEKEACPNNLAPTTSTTAQLVLGDALAVCLLKARNFGSDDFAKYHPGGALGKSLYLKVGDLLHHDLQPVVSPEATIQEVLLEISSNRMGATVVLENDDILGVITDGDIRRMLEKHHDFGTLRAKDIMGGDPKYIEANELAAEAMKIMEDNSITQLIVMSAGRYVGFVHVHDILREGII